MSGEDLQQLIHRLQQLQIQRDNISAEERRLTETIARQITGTNNGINNVGFAHRAVVEEDDDNGGAAATNNPSGFVLGQHVFITNQVPHVDSTRRVTNADRAAVVTHFTRGDRVAVETYNGDKTHRLPKYLRPLSSEEQVSCFEQRRR